jgi:hypothetical protein
MLKGGKTPKEEGKIEIGRGEETNVVQKKKPQNKKATQLKKGNPNPKKTSIATSLHSSLMLPLLPHSVANAHLLCLSTLLVKMPLLFLP